MDAGSLKHRFESRAAALNSLRLQAVRELRIAGTLYEQEKELPGPNASEWVHWACNLREENDASIFADLRRDFPALERFAGETPWAHVDIQSTAYLDEQRDYLAAGATGAGVRLLTELATRMSREQSTTG